MKVYICLTKRYYTDLYTTIGKFGFYMSSEREGDGALQNVLCKVRFEDNNNQHYKKYTAFMSVVLHYRYPYVNQFVMKLN